MGMWDIPKNQTQEGRFTEEELTAFTQSIARTVVRYRMSVPAIMALELSKPVAFLGYSSMVAFSPMLDMMFDPLKVDKLTCILSDRDRIEQLIVAIETLECELQNKGRSSLPSYSGNAHEFKLPDKDGENREH